MKLAISHRARLLAVAAIIITVVLWTITTSISAAPSTVSSLIGPSLGAFVGTAAFARSASLPEPGMAVECDATEYGRSCNNPSGAYVVPVIAGVIVVSVYVYFAMLTPYKRQDKLGFLTPKIQKYLFPHDRCRRLPPPSPTPRDWPRNWSPLPRSGRSIDSQRTLWSHWSSATLVGTSDEPRVENDIPLQTLSPVHHDPSTRTL